MGKKRGKRKLKRRKAEKKELQNGNEIFEVLKLKSTFELIFYNFFARKKIFFDSQLFNCKNPSVIYFHMLFPPFVFETKATMIDVMNKKRKKKGKKKQCKNFGSFNVSLRWPVDSLSKMSTQSMNDW